MSDIPGRMTLTKPITKRFKQADGSEREEQVTELTVRPVFARDLRATDKHDGEVAKGIALAAHLTDMSIADIDGLPQADFVRLMELIEDPTSGGRETGTTSSAT